MQNQNRKKMLIIIAGIWLAYIVLNSLSSTALMKSIPYSEFLKLIKEGKVSEVAISDSHRITLTRTFIRVTAWMVS